MKKLLVVLAIVTSVATGYFFQRWNQYCPCAYPQANSVWQRQPPNVVDLHGAADFLCGVNLYGVEITKPHHEKTVKALNDIKVKAEKVFDREFPPIVLHYDVVAHGFLAAGMTVADQAGQYHIILNPVFINKFGDALIDEVVIHEYAHMVTNVLYPDSGAHDHEWRATMNKLGVKHPEATHNYILCN